LSGSWSAPDAAHQRIENGIMDEALDRIVFLLSFLKRCGFGIDPSHILNVVIIGTGQYVVPLFFFLRFISIESFALGEHIYSDQLVTVPTPHFVAP